jgi:hypothetical protein
LAAGDRQARAEIIPERNLQFETGFCQGEETLKMGAVIGPASRHSALNRYSRNTLKDVCALR